MQMEQEFPAHNLMRIENQIQAKHIFIVFKKYFVNIYFFQLKNVMKNLKHKDIHITFKHIYLITFNSSHFYTRLVQRSKRQNCKKIEFLQKYQFAYLLKIIVLKNYLVFVNGLAFNKSINVKIFFDSIKFHCKLFHFWI